jgi:hypothetical protein
MTSKVAAISAAIESLTGLALLAIPGLVSRVLLGVGLSSSGVAVARVAGFGLLSLGIASWPAKGIATPQAIRALFTYNLLAAIYFFYLKVSGTFATNVLWLAFGLHILLALLLARPAFGMPQQERPSVPPKSDG